MKARVSSQTFVAGIVLAMISGGLWLTSYAWGAGYTFKIGKWFPGVANYNGNFVFWYNDQDSSPGFYANKANLGRSETDPPDGELFQPLGSFVWGPDAHYKFLIAIPHFVFVAVWLALAATGLFSAKDRSNGSP